MSKNLRPKQKAFIREYLLCRNASEALRRAGYKSKNPDVDGHKLLVTPSIKAIIEDHERKAQEKFEITQEMMIKEIAAVAFFDMEKATEISQGGSLKIKTWSEMGQHTRKAIKAITENETQFGRSLSFSTHDKLKAIEMLNKYLNIFKEGKDAKDPGSGIGKNSAESLTRRAVDIINRRIGRGTKKVDTNSQDGD